MRDLAPSFNDFFERLLRAAESSFERDVLRVAKNDLDRRYEFTVTMYELGSDGSLSPDHFRKLKMEWKPHDAEGGG